MPERVQERVGGVQISVAGRPVRSETTATAAGPSVLVLITALGELGVTVTSSYIGHQGTETIAAHLIVTRHREELERVEREAVPVTHARERCLLDHASQVQEAVMAHTASAVAVDVAPATLARGAFV